MGKIGNNKFVDMTGQKIGLWLCKEYLKDTGGRWLCECTGCGKEAKVRGNKLRNGHTNGCGSCSGKTRAKRKRSEADDRYDDDLITYVPYWLFARFERGAIMRELDFELTGMQMEELYVKQDKRCAISNVPLQMEKHQYKTGLVTASLDRIDAGLGYTIDNVQWVHKEVNMAKKAMSDEVFIDMCQHVAEHHKGLVFPEGEGWSFLRG